MSELKEVMNVMQVSGERIPSGYYKKSEADKVIADLIEKNERLANNSLIMASETIKDLLKEIHHQKYKRCLDKAKWCESEAYIHEHGSEYDEDLVAWFGKWHKRWLELAEKFKEADDGND